MLNYTMIYGVSEVARILRVDRDLIKKWAYTFSDYISKEANPTKGTPRKFSVDDIRVFTYVLLEWEDDPDIEAIKIGLNREEHFENPYNDFISQITPMFKDVSTINEYTRHGTVFAGMSELADRLHLADSYKLAGDKLVDAAIENEQAFDLICPIIYNYRHATELYLKSINSEIIIEHNLKLLAERFKSAVEEKNNQRLPDWFMDTILVFNDFDPDGKTFRYGGSVPGDEIFIDLNLLRLKMGWIAESFQKIRETN